MDHAATRHPILQQAQAVGDVLVHWLLFSVLFALLPIAFALIRMLCTGDTIGLVPLFARGDLLLISVGLASNAVGESLAGPTLGRRPRSFALGSCVLLVAVASFWYSEAQQAQAALTLLGNRQAVNSLTSTTVGSLGIFMVTVLASFTCIYEARLQLLRAARNV